MAINLGYDPRFFAQPAGTGAVPGVAQTSGAGSALQGGGAATALQPAAPAAGFQPAGAGGTLNTSGVPKAPVAPAAPTAATFASEPAAGGSAGGASPYTTYNQGQAGLTLDQSSFANQQAYDAYKTAVDAYNQSNTLADQERGSDLGVAQNQGNIQSGRINEDAATTAANIASDKAFADKELTKQHDRAATDLNYTTLLNKGNIQTGYSARGLGSSSAVNTALAGVDYASGTQGSRLEQDTTDQRAHAEDLFNRNVKGLNVNTQRQLQDVDQYLKNLQTKYDFQTKNIDVGRYSQDQNYKAAADNLAFQKDQIAKSRELLHNYVNSTLGSISGPVQSFAPTAQNAALPADYNAGLNAAIKSDPYANPVSNQAGGSPYGNLQGAYINPFAVNDPNKPLTVANAPK